MGCKPNKATAAEPKNEEEHVEKVTADGGVKFEELEGEEKKVEQAENTPDPEKDREQPKEGAETTPAVRFEAEVKFDKVNAPKLTTDAVRSILQETKASEEQLKFFQAWDELVFKAIPQESSGASVVISTDLSYLEIRVVAGPGHMVELARNFCQACHVPQSQVEEMHQLHSVAVTDRATLWCKFKNMGERNTEKPEDHHQKLRQPTVDAGFTIHGEMDWIVADMLMPAIDDQDALRDYAVQELHTPSSYGSSIFPVEPEKSLTFEMSGGIPRKLLLSAFFFFKSLGFAKPEDAVVRVLSSCQSQKYVIGVSMGPQGLTRLVVSLYEPSRPAIASELADCLRYSFEKDGIERINQILKGAEVEFIDYIADSTGYSVGYGFLLGGYESY